MAALNEVKLKKLVELRREFHAHAETGWTEFWTTAKIAGILDSLGYKVLAGREMLNLESVMGRPSEEEIKVHIERALSQGADPGWIERMDGYTGALGI
ncbi:MAG: peptidase M20, partial [Aminobacteriaceae bacterium]